MGNDKNDLTRIEDLSEYLHQEDPEAEALLNENSFQDEDEDQQQLEDELDLDLEEADDDSLEFNQNEETLETEDILDEESLNEEQEDTFDFSPETSELAIEDENDLVEEQSLEFEIPTETENEAKIEEDEEELEFDDDEDDNDEIEVDGELNFGDIEEVSSEDNVSQEEQVEQEDTEITKEPDTSPLPQEEEVISVEPAVVETELEEMTLPSIPPEAETTPEPYVFKERENFQDIRNFGNNLTYGVISTQANPPFSILIENINSKNDGDYFISVLREHGLVTDQNEQDFLTSLKYGRLLVSQISEYSAVYLAHKFRSYPVKIKMGLADDIHSSVNYDDDGQGRVSSQNINQNTFQQQDFTEEPGAHIVMSTSLTLESYFVEQYMDILTVEKTISEDEFLNEEENIVQSEYYQPIMDRLKDKAKNIGANGVVGIDFQHTYLENKASYKILCTGNAVYLRKKD